LGKKKTVALAAAPTEKATRIREGVGLRGNDEGNISNGAGGTLPLKALVKRGKANQR